MKWLLNILKEDDLDNFAWLIPHEGDITRFMKNRLMKTLVYTISLLIASLVVVHFVWGVTTNSLILIILFNLVIALFVFKNDYFKIKSSFNTKKKNVYRSFPLWVSTLEILIMTNNITNTFKKSIPTCPEVFRSDLEEFVKKIEFDPENKESYREFLSKYNIDDVTEVIMDMYAFNKLNKDEIVHEFKHVNERLNKISAKLRQERQSTSLFGISALNSVPLFTLSVYILMISMLMNIN